LLLLPLADIKAVFVLPNEENLVDYSLLLQHGPGDSAHAVSAAADRMLVASRVLSRTCVGDKAMPISLLTMAWGQVPVHPALSVIAATGMHGLRGQVKSLHLTKWPIDKALILQLTETHPRLESLGFGRLSYQRLRMDRSVAQIHQPAPHEA
jgi:hypothetical protein